MAMKSTIVDFVVEQCKLSQNDASKAVNAVFTAIEHYLKQGEQVTVPKFGTFYPRKIQPFSGYNIIKKEITPFKGGQTVRLKVSKILRSHLEAA